MDCTLTHDAVGNLTDDGKDYSYVSDAFGRLKTVKNRGSSAVVAEYTCNGLNMRIDWYTSYGIPFRIDPGDYSRDGYVNGNDLDDDGDDFDNARSEADVNFDGDVDEDDYDLFSAWWDAPSTAGRFTLSASSIGSRIGYAGYQHNPTFVGASRAIYHVRNRVYDAGLGRWMRRDPIGYKAGVNLCAYVNSMPFVVSDPYGLWWANFDFLLHYYLGFGAPVDLASIGMLEEYKAHPAIVKARETIKNVVQLQAMKRGQQLVAPLSCDFCNSKWEDWRYFTIGRTRHPISRSDFVDSYEYKALLSLDVGIFFAGWTFSIGGHSLYWSSSCMIYASACNNCKGAPGWHYEYSCDIDFSMEDKFTDPLSLTEMFGLFGYKIRDSLEREMVNRAGDVIAGGTAYDIYGGWSEPLDGCVDVPKKGGAVCKP